MNLRPLSVSLGIACGLLLFAKACRSGGIGQAPATDSGAGDMQAGDSPPTGEDSTPPSGDSGGQETDTPDTGPAPPEEIRFSFAVIADPHVSGPGDYAERLVRAVDWINAAQVDPPIELVLVIGDICWDQGMELAKQALDALQVTYVPVIGDNEVEYGSEEAYASTFEPQYQLLAGTLDNWSKAPLPVWNPEHETQSWIHNFSFDHRGLRFVGLDWTTRSLDSADANSADLHDFEGGSMPWFQQAVAEAAHGPQERIVLLSHHPMVLSGGGFDAEEMAQVEAVTAEHAGFVYANFGGHYHLDVELVVKEGGYEVFVTDAICDDEITVRLVRVEGDEQAVSYSHELVLVK